MFRDGIVFPSASVVREINEVASKPALTPVFRTSKFSRVLGAPAFHDHFFVRIKLH